MCDDLSSTGSTADVDHRTSHSMDLPLRTSTITTEVLSLLHILFPCMFQILVGILLLIKDSHQSFHVVDKSLLGIDIVARGFQCRSDAPAVLGCGSNPNDCPDIPPSELHRHIGYTCTEQLHDPNPRGPNSYLGSVRIYLSLGKTIRELAVLFRTARIACTHSHL